MPTPRRRRPEPRFSAAVAAVGLVLSACGGLAASSTGEALAGIGAEPPPPVLIDLPITGSSFPVVALATDVERTGRSAILAVDPDTGALDWEVDVPFSASGVVLPVDDRLIYACSCAGGTLVAALSTTGEPLWMKQGGKWQLQDVVAGSDTVVVSLASPRTAKGAVVALNLETGVPYWITYREGVTDQGRLVVVDDTVFVESEDGVIRGVDPIQGNDLWTARLTPPLGPIFTTGERVFVPSDGALIQLDPATGEAIVALPAPAAVVDPGIESVLGYQEGIAVALASSVVEPDLALVGAADVASGEYLWTRVFDPERLTQVIGTEVQAEVVEGSGKNLRGFDVATGKKLWAIAAGRGGIEPSSVVVGGSMTYAVAKGEITAIGRKGVAKWTVPLEGLPTTPVVADRTLYVPAAEGADGTGGFLVALNVRNGGERWQIRTALPVMYPVLAGDRLVAFTSSRAEALVE